jgi:hypothetical protein
LIAYGRYAELRRGLKRRRSHYLPMERPVIEATGEAAMTPGLVMQGSNPAMSVHPSWWVLLSTRQAGLLSLGQSRSPPGSHWRSLFSLAPLSRHDALISLSFFPKF